MWMMSQKLSLWHLIVEILSRPRILLPTLKKYYSLVELLKAKGMHKLFHGFVNFFCSFQLHQCGIGTFLVDDFKQASRYHLIIVVIIIIVIILVGIELFCCCWDTTVTALHVTIVKKTDTPTYQSLMEFFILMEDHRSGKRPRRSNS